MVLFTLQFHSVVDVITNSSSELFVGLEGSKDLMVNLVKEIYPDYLSEYSEIKTIDELSDGDLDLYINYHYYCWSNSEQRSIYNVIDGFTYDEMYITKKHSWGSTTYIRRDFVKNNRDRVNNAIDSERKMFFMFSSDDNPDWDMQEELMNIMTRYHLG